jgi:hypothetical protein
MQTPSTIALLAAEISHMRNTVDDAEASGAAKGRAAIGPLGAVDDYIARQRTLEELLSFYRPQSAADAAVLAAHLSQRTAIVRYDYAAPAGIDDAAAELDRLAAALADWHNAQAVTAVNCEGTGLIAALAVDLEKACALLEAADATSQCEMLANDRSRIAGNISKACATIHAIESGIAAARLRSEDDAKTAATLLYAESEATIPGRGRMLALSLAAYYGEAGEAACETIRRRYGPRPSLPAVAAEAEARAVH